MESDSSDEDTLPKIIPSRYDNRYHAHICAYCQEPIVETETTQRIVAKERANVWQNVYNTIEIPFKEWNRIMSEIEERDGGNIQTRIHWLHFRCRSLLNEEQIYSMHEAAKFQLPTILPTIIHHIELDKRLPHSCNYCNMMITDTLQGFFSDNISMHYICYNVVRDIEIKKTKNLIEELNTTDKWEHYLERNDITHRMDIISQFITFYQKQSKLLIKPGSYLEFIRDYNDENKKNEYAQLKEIDNILNAYPRNELEYLGAIMVRNSIVLANAIHQKSMKKVGDADKVVVDDVIVNDDTAVDFLKDDDGISFLLDPGDNNEDSDI